MQKYSKFPNNPNLKGKNLGGLYHIYETTFEIHELRGSAHGTDRRRKGSILPKSRQKQNKEETQPTDF